MRAGEEVSVEVPEPREVGPRGRGHPALDPLRGRAPDRDRQAARASSSTRPRDTPPARSSTPCSTTSATSRASAARLRPGIVHRLDRDTSGVLLVAKTDRAHQLLSRQMRKRTLRKEYLALVAGVPRVRKGEDRFRDRPRSARPQEDEGVSRRRPGRRRRALGRPARSTRSRGVAGAGAHPAALPPRDRPHAPDPRPPRGRGAPGRRRPGLRQRPLSAGSRRGRSEAGSRPSRARLCTPSASRSTIPRTQELIEIVAPLPADLAGLLAAIDAPPPDFVRAGGIAIRPPEHGHNPDLTLMKEILYDGRHLVLLRRNGWEYVEHRTAPEAAMIVAITAQTRSFSPRSSVLR